MSDLDLINDDSDISEGSSSDDSEDLSESSQAMSSEDEDDRIERKKRQGADRQAAEGKHVAKKRRMRVHR